MEAPGVESGVGEGVSAVVGSVCVRLGGDGGESDVRSTAFGVVGQRDHATLARIALERLERGDVEAVAALLRVLADGV